MHDNRWNNLRLKTTYLKDPTSDNMTNFNVYSYEITAKTWPAETSIIHQYFITLMAIRKKLV